MNKATRVVQFSTDANVAFGFEMLAAREGRDMGDIFRDMYRAYQFEKTLEEVQASAALASRKRSLETDDDVVRYLDEN